MPNTWISNYRAAARRPIENIAAGVSEYEDVLVARASLNESRSAEHQPLCHEIDADLLEALIRPFEEMRDVNGKPKSDQLAAAAAQRSVFSWGRHVRRCTSL